jgi:hypothetical protein
MKRSIHVTLLDAGWSYRTNADRGWVIYRDPATGLWHTRDEAIRILEAADAVRFVLPRAS